MTPRINKAIDIFLKAIENGTLAKGTCAACAVGNLVADGIGFDLSKDKNPTNYSIDGNQNIVKPNTGWSLLFFTAKGGQEINMQKLSDIDVVSNIEATDFTWQELAKIEFAFETNSKIKYNYYDGHTKEQIRADQVRGLEAVIEVMLDFDDVTASVQELFTDKANLIPVLN